MRPAKRVLVVGGSEHARQVLAMQLSVWGYRVVEARCAADVCDALQAQQFDAAVISDYEAAIVLREARLMDPELRSIVIGARPESVLVANGLLPAKYNAADLRQRVHIVTARRRGPKMQQRAEAC